MPASTLSFVTFSQMVFSHVGHGAAYVEGGMQSLIDALVLAIERRGGEVVCGTAVERIEVDGGRVTGVRLAGGARVSAPVVVSNADPFQTFGPLLGDDAPVGYLRRIESPHARRSPASSSSGRRTWTWRPRATSPSTSTPGTPRRRYRRTVAGDPGYSGLWAPSVVDQTLAPAGQQVVLALTPMYYDAGAPWAEIKARFAPRVWRHLDALVPGLSESLIFSESATPLTLERFSGNHRGSQYGWDLGAKQKASLRPDIATPLGGLFLAGHWTALGGGFLRSTLTGVSAADRILARDGLETPCFVSDMSAVA